VQILANALPGFRDLRAPLTAGYIWLLFAWLWASPDPDQMTTGFGGSLHDLSQRAGPIWTGLAVGVAAYSTFAFRPVRHRYRSLQKDLDAQKIISDAIGIERIKAVSLTKFSQWVEDGLPSEIERLKMI